MKKSLHYLIYCEILLSIFITVKDNHDPDLECIEPLEKRQLVEELRFIDKPMSGQKINATNCPKQMRKYPVIFLIIVIFSVYNITNCELSVLHCKNETGTAQVHSINKTDIRQGNSIAASKNYDSRTVTSISKLWSPRKNTRFYLNHTIVAKISEVSYTVPRKIHFLWIQSSLPKKYFRNVLTYHRNNPEYQINLWLDQNTLEKKLILQSIQVLGNTSYGRIIIRDVEDIRMKNYNIFQTEKNVGSKADIVRLELVYQEGGIYSDIDSVSMRSFDDLFRHSFVTYTLHWVFGTVFRMHVLDSGEIRIFCILF